jgi:CBS domain-containing protein
MSKPFSGKPIIVELSGNKTKPLNRSRAAIRSPDIARQERTHKEDFMSIPIRNILSRKGWEVVSVSPQKTLLEVADILVSRHIGAVTVLDGEGNLLGLVSERDIVTGLSEHHDDVMTLTAADVMAHPVRTCSPDCTIYDAMQMMTTYRHRHIPIMEDDKLIGLVSIGDLVKYRLEEADLFVEEMRAYVMQTDPGHDPGMGHYAAR